MKKRRNIGRFTVSAFVVLASLATIKTASGQAEEKTKSSSLSPATLLDSLTKLHYDAAENGPLLVVAPYEQFRENDIDLTQLNRGRVSYRTLARWSQRSVARIGELNVLAPKSMKVIDANPPRANLLAGLTAADALKVLLGTLTRGEWAVVCSADGIGIADLNREQRSLFEACLPVDLKVRRLKVDNVFGPGSYSGTDSEEITIPDRSTARLRLNRASRCDFYVSQPASQVFDDPREAGPPSIDTGNLNPQSGQTVTELEQDGSDTGLIERYEGRTTAFGVRIVRTVRNTQKPSDLDYSSSFLDRRVYMGDVTSKTTIGDLVERISQASKLDIVCDTRARNIPIYWRGQSARVGDLLQAIALSLSGTYRKVGASATYVLTIDADGFGAKMARLGIWSDAANAARTRLVDDSVLRASKNDPLGYLQFSPADTMALSQDLTDRIDKRDKMALTPDVEYTDVAELPPGLRSEIHRTITAWKKPPNATIDPSKAFIDIELSASVILPHIGALRLNVDDGDLYHELAYGKLSEQLPAPAPAAVPAWKSISKKFGRNVAVFGAATPTDAEEFIGAAARSGFSEIWIRVDHNSGASTTRAVLTAAIDAGKRTHTAIGADISLLKFDGVGGEAERNILRQIGTEFVGTEIPRQLMSIDQCLQQGGASDLFIDYGSEPAGCAAIVPELNTYWCDWHAMSLDELMPRVSDIATIPGVSAIVLTNSAPPGIVARDPNLGSDLVQGGELGFTDTRRVAFLHKFGVDPIDIGEQDAQLDAIDFFLPFFSDGNLQETPTDSDVANSALVAIRELKSKWTQFVEAENTNLIRSICLRLKQVRPNLPVWLDDRPCAYSELQPSWYGLMGNESHLAHRSESTDELSNRSAAFSTYRNALRSVTIAPKLYADQPLECERIVSRAGQQALRENWSGVVVDFSQQNVQDSLGLLGALEKEQRAPVSRVP